MIGLLLFLIIVGVLLYLVGQIPMDPAILLIIRVVAILLIVLYVIQAFGFVDIPLPRMRR